MVGTNETVAKVLAMNGQDAPSDDDFKAMAIPDFARIEIPIRDRYAFAEIADHLAELARRLSGLHHDARYDNLTACSMALTRCRMTTRLVKQARLKNRLDTKSGG